MRALSVRLQAPLVTQSARLALMAQVLQRKGLLGATCACLANSQGQTTLIVNRAQRVRILRRAPPVARLAMLGNTPQSLHQTVTYAELANIRSQEVMGVQIAR